MNLWAYVKELGWWWWFPKSIQIYSRRRSFNPLVKVGPTVRCPWKLHAVNSSFGLSISYFTCYKVLTFPTCVGFFLACTNFLPTCMDWFFVCMKLSLGSHPPTWIKNKKVVNLSIAMPLFNEFSGPYWKWNSHPVGVFGLLCMKATDPKLVGYESMDPKPAQVRIQIILTRNRRTITLVVNVLVRGDCILLKHSPAYGAHRNVCL